MMFYPAEHERRLRLHVPEFEVATEEAHRSWALIDITSAFERWMAGHEYREEYFESPDLLSPALPAFFEHLVDEVCGELANCRDQSGVVGVLGAGTLFGLGNSVKVSALLDALNEAVAGRLLVFFPGEHRGQQLPAARCPRRLELPGHPDHPKGDW